MTWLRIDDSFATHPKIIGLSTRAFRVHVEALVYCARHLTDGIVPKAAQKCTKSVREELQNAGLWAVDEVGNVIIHDFLEWNPSAASIRAKRERDSERKSKRNPRGIQAEPPKRSARNLLGIRGSLPDPKETSNDVSARGRPKDPIWDALAELFGTVASGTSAHGKRNRAVKDLKLSGATAESVKSAHVRYMKHWPSITPTDTGLAKHYPQLMNGTAQAQPPCPKCGTGGGMHTADCEEAK